jgi:hypothetical protein
MIISANTSEKVLVILNFNDKILSDNRKISNVLVNHAYEKAINRIYTALQMMMMTSMVQ